MFTSTDEERAAPIVPAGYHLASFGRRIGGLIIDQLVITVPVFVAFYVFGHSPRAAVSEGRAIWFTVAITALGLVYETIGVWRWGRTLGKLLMGTRVVSIVDGGPLGLTRAFQRSLVPTSLGAIPQVGIVLGIGIYVWAFFDPLRQGIHDKAAGSIVVRGHRID
ncbi:MAG: RDD family protein [Ilumatobacteraceae bacterium]